MSLQIDSVIGIIHREMYVRDGVIVGANAAAEQIVKLSNNSMMSIAVEKTLIVEKFQKLLGVYTTDEAFKRLGEIMKYEPKPCLGCGGWQIHKEGCFEILAFRALCHLSEPE